MEAGIIGGIAGGVIGLLGGIVGAYFSIRNTNSQRERSFVFKCSVICFIAIIAFSILSFTLPSPYLHFLWLPYSILLPLGIVAVNRRQQKIREMESKHNKPSHPTADNVQI